MKSRFAIQSLYQDHKTWLANWFRRRVSSSDQPMDLVQDTFLRVLSSERAAEIDDPRAYLTVVARQLLIDRRRHQNLVDAYEAQLAAAEPAHAPSEEQRAIVRQTLRRLDALIQRLPEPVRLTLLLSRVDGLTYGEIAQRLAVSERTVKRYMVQAYEDCLMAMLSQDLEA